jgi:hypothetical protein
MLMKQGIANRNIFPACLLAAGLLLAWSGGIPATEVHTWTDENGVVHFSDAPRASGKSQTLEVEEIYRPGTTEAYSGSESPDSKEAEGGQAETPPSTAQQRRDNIARERQERRENQAVTEQMCKLHKDRLARVEPARRVMYTNDEGELIRMDDDERMALVDESREFISKNCE